MSNIKCKWLLFDELSPALLYEIMRMRHEIFVIEQNCDYQDADNIDQKSYHFIACLGEKQKPVGYLRVIPPGVKGKEVMIGRVLVIKELRGKGLGKKMVAGAVKKIETIYPGIAIRINAQSHLQKFYEAFGFQAVSQPHMESGIPHVGMLRTPPAKKPAAPSAPAKAGTTKTAPAKIQPKQTKPVDTESAQDAPKTACLNSMQMAAFSSNTCTKEEKENYLAHIGTCKTCYQEYVSLMMLNMKSEPDANIIYILNYPINIKALTIALAIVGIGFLLMFLV
ncbi:MAG: hypothetical protein CSB24_02205 [Deltaproteobacteria bacterium]|nr:MAG: hypothetical protein CSB24_02205 [Deltaproteobacteria bacterium]